MNPYIQLMLTITGVQWTSTANRNLGYAVSRSTAFTSCPADPVTAQ